MSVRSRGPALTLTALTAAWIVLGTPALSSAYSDPSMFDRPALAAGGGKRHFTGSPADGYSCSVCHEGGSPPRLDVTGLPLSGYAPSVAYEIVVTWNADVKRFATALEFTDERGQPAGSLRLPPADELQPPEYCEPASDAIMAASLSELDDGRRIIHVPDCGARRLRFLWTAPATDRRTVWFAGSAVSSDGEADVYHDGVTDYGRVLSASGTASTWESAGCAVTARASCGGRPPVISLTTLACLLFIARWRRARRR